MSSVIFAMDVSPRPPGRQLVEQPHDGFLIASFSRNGSSWCDRALADIQEHQNSAQR